MESGHAPDAKRFAGECRSSPRPSLRRRGAWVRQARAVKRSRARQGRARRTPQGAQDGGRDETVGRKAVPKSLAAGICFRNRASANSIEAMFRDAEVRHINRSAGSADIAWHHKMRRLPQGRASVLNARRHEAACNRDELLPPQAGQRRPPVSPQPRRPWAINARAKTERTAVEISSRLDESRQFLKGRSG